jgi:hypothetical protein
MKGLWKHGRIINAISAGKTTLRISDVRIPRGRVGAATAGVAGSDAAIPVAYHLLGFVGIHHFLQCGHGFRRSVFDCSQNIA